MLLWQIIIPGSFWKIVDVTLAGYPARDLVDVTLVGHPVKDLVDVTQADHDVIELVSVTLAGHSARDLAEFQNMRQLGTLCLNL